MGGPVGAVVAAAARTVRDGWLDERAAYVALAAAMEAREREVASEPDRDVTFADAVARWMHHLEFVKGVKPSTLADYRYLLALWARRRVTAGVPPAARIMRAFGNRPLFEITPAEVGRYLASLDADPTIGPRTVNKHRQVLCTVFEHAMREDTSACRRTQPGARTSAASRTPSRSTSTRSRRCSRSCARRGRPAPRPEPSGGVGGGARRARPLRRAGRGALRRRGIHRAAHGRAARAALAQRRLRDARLVVEASWSAGVLTSPKSRKFRSVPLADQPAAVLAQLAARERFTGRDDLVFCNAVGGYLDGSALRRRYRRAQRAAGLRPLRFHDLRHSFGSLVIREFDLVSVKAFMGHAKITTTERYLHARPRRDDAARMTKVFDASVGDLPVREIEPQASADLSGSA